ncbi:MAG TPA: hypothetical protein VLI39_00340 [Sedimentisphaerales bacterium]|nr:hypothetical protein [Sedimentisphaerales bacterium]
MHTCSIMRSLELVPGDMSDYAKLAAHHYRRERPVAVKAVYALRPIEPLGSFGRKTAGVIVYTMPAMNVPIVEALGVMPLANPFLERAGMKVYEPRVPVEHVKLIEAFSAAGVEERDLVSPATVQERLDRLTGSRKAFIEHHIAEFLKSHGTRRTMPRGIERTRYLPGKLTHRPSYYIWFNPFMTEAKP